MERLIKPALDGGVPYINQDFYNILQQNNLTSYKSFLETINDNPGSGNSGIIVKGVRNVTPTGVTNALNFDFTNSMIYLDGDFLEPIPALALESSSVINATKFYLVKVKFSEEIREKKVSGFFEPVLEKFCFDKTTTQPSNQPYIEIEVKNGKNYCQRYLERLLRYYMTDFGQVQMTVNGDFFDATGKGFGDMYGFVLCDGQDSSIDLKDKYLINFSSLSNYNATETDANGNYSKLGNTGGKSAVVLTEDNLPTHNHGGNTGIADNEMRHSHIIQVLDRFPHTMFSSFTLNPNFRVFTRGNKVIPRADLPNEENSQEDVIRRQSGFSKTKDYLGSKVWGLIPNNTIIHTFQNRSPKNLGDHTHPTLPATFGGAPHNNLPPSNFILHYEKIDPY